MFVPSLSWQTPPFSHTKAVFPAHVQETLFSCRSGVGDAFMNLVELVKDFGPTSDPRVCNWSDPIFSTLPDSGSRTCASTFPAGSQSGLAGSVYLVGNQIDTGRDPVTLNLAKGRNAIFVPFICKNEQFTKTGSGQT